MIIKLNKVMVFIEPVVSIVIDTTQNTIKKYLLGIARYCQTLPDKNRKSPVVTGL